MSVPIIIIFVFVGFLMGVALSFKGSIILTIVVFVILVIWSVVESNKSSGFSPVPSIGGVIIFFILIGRNPYL